MHVIVMSGRLLLSSPTLFQAFGQAYSTQRKVAEDGETNEETLLQESASKEAYYMGRLLELQSELKHSRASTSNAQADNEHLSTVLQELREVQYRVRDFISYIIYQIILYNMYVILKIKRVTQSYS